MLFRSGECLRGGKHFSINEIVKYGMEISEVFSYFHGQKPPVYYGDLKPDNLMLGENGRLYLVDLGCAVNGYKYHHKVYRRMIWQTALFCLVHHRIIRSLQRHPLN